MVVSKKIKQLLRKYQPNHHWHVDDLKSMNTYHCLSEFIQEKPEGFLPKLFVDNETKSRYKEQWLSIKSERTIKHNTYLNESPFSDLKVFDEVLKSTPNNSQLQLSNSSIVRYAQLFDVNDSLEVYCNRGTSGIDGSTSTAIGAAFARDNQTVLSKPPNFRCLSGSSEYCASLWGADSSGRESDAWESESDFSQRRRIICISP